MGETEALEDALARSDRGKARLESENAQLRRELKKVRSTLDELLERFQTAVRTARRFAGMLFSSSSERLGGSAETVVSEVELDCPAFIWDDDPTGGLAGGGAANGEAVDPFAEHSGPSHPLECGSVLHEVCHSCPEFCGTGHWLSFGWDEADISTEIDGEGSEVGDIVGRGPAADHAVVVQAQIEHEDFVSGHDLVGGPVGGFPGGAIQIEHAPRGDGVEREALAQVLGIVEAAVLDAGSGLEDAEELFDGPARFVPLADAVGPFGRGLAFGAKQQPAEWLASAGRRVALGNEHGGHGQRVRRLAFGRDEFDASDAQRQHGLALLACRPAAPRGNLDAARCAGRESVHVLAEVQLFAVHQHLALFRAAGAHQQAGGGGILGLAGVQTPHVPFLLL